LEELRQSFQYSSVPESASKTNSSWENDLVKDLAYLRGAWDACEGFGQIVYDSRSPSGVRRFLSLKNTLWVDAFNVKEIEAVNAERDVSSAGASPSVEQDSSEIVRSAFFDDAPTSTNSAAVSAKSILSARRLFLFDLSPDFSSFLTSDDTVVDVPQGAVLPESALVAVLAPLEFPRLSSAGGASTGEFDSTCAATTASSRLSFLLNEPPYAPSGLFMPPNIVAPALALPSPPSTDAPESVTSTSPSAHVLALLCALVHRAYDIFRSTEDESRIFACGLAVGAISRASVGATALIALRLLIGNLKCVPAPVATAQAISSAAADAQSPSALLAVIRGAVRPLLVAFARNAVCATDPLAIELCSLATDAISRFLPVLLPHPVSRLRFSFLCIDFEISLTDVHSCVEMADSVASAWNEATEFWDSLSESFARRLAPSFLTRFAVDPSAASFLLAECDKVPQWSGLDEIASKALSRGCVAACSSAFEDTSCAAYEKLASHVRGGGLLRIVGAAAESAVSASGAVDANKDDGDPCGVYEHAGRPWLPTSVLPAHGRALEETPPEWRVPPDTEHVLFGDDCDTRNIVKYDGQEVPDSAAFLTMFGGRGFIACVSDRCFSQESVYGLHVVSLNLEAEEVLRDYEDGGSGSDGGSYDGQPNTGIAPFLGVYLQRKGGEREQASLSADRLYLVDSSGHVLERGVFSGRQINHGNGIPSSGPVEVVVDIEACSIGFFFCDTGIWEPNVFSNLDVANHDVSVVAAFPYAAGGGFDDKCSFVDLMAYFKYDTRSRTDISSRPGASHSSQSDGAAASNDAALTLTNLAYIGNLVDPSSSSVRDALAVSAPVHPASSVALARFDSIISAQRLLRRSLEPLLRSLVVAASAGNAMSAPALSLLRLLQELIVGYSFVGDKAAHCTAVFEAGVTGKWSADAAPDAAPLLSSTGRRVNSSAGAALPSVEVILVPYPEAPPSFPTTSYQRTVATQSVLSVDTPSELQAVLDDKSLMSSMLNEDALMVFSRDPVAEVVQTPKVAPARFTPASSSQAPLIAVAKNRKLKVSVCPQTGGTTVELAQKGGVSSSTSLSTAAGLIAWRVRVDKIFPGSILAIGISRNSNVFDSALGDSRESCGLFIKSDKTSSRSVGDVRYKGSTSKSIPLISAHVGSVLTLAFDSLSGALLLISEAGASFPRATLLESGLLSTSSPWRPAVYSSEGGSSFSFLGYLNGALPGLGGARWSEDYEERYPDAQKVALPAQESSAASTNNVAREPFRLSSILWPARDCSDFLTLPTSIEGAEPSASLQPAVVTLLRALAGIDCVSLQSGCTAPLFATLCLWSKFDATLDAAASSTTTPAASNWDAIFDVASRVLSATLPDSCEPPTRLVARLAAALCAQIRFDRTFAVKAAIIAAPPARLLLDAWSEDATGEESSLCAGLSDRLAELAASAKSVHDKGNVFLSTLQPWVIERLENLSVRPQPHESSPRWTLASIIGVEKTATRTDAFLSLFLEPSETTESHKKARAWLTATRGARTGGLKVKKGFEELGAVATAICLHALGVADAAAADFDKFSRSSAGGVTTSGDSATPPLIRLAVDAGTEMMKRSEKAAPLDTLRSTARWYLSHVCPSIVDAKETSTEAAAADREALLSSSGILVLLDLFSKQDAYVHSEAARDLFILRLWKRHCVDVARTASFESFHRLFGDSSTEASVDACERDSSMVSLFQLFLTAGSDNTVTVVPPSLSRSDVITALADKCDNFEDRILLAHQLFSNIDNVSVISLLRGGAPAAATAAPQSPSPTAAAVQITPDGQTKTVAYGLQSPAPPAAVSEALVPSTPARLLPRVPVCSAALLRALGKDGNASLSALIAGLLYVNDGSEKSSAIPNLFASVSKRGSDPTGCVVVEGSSFLSSSLRFNSDGAVFSRNRRLVITAGQVFSRAAAGLLRSLCTSEMALRFARASSVALGVVVDFLFGGKFEVWDATDPLLFGCERLLESVEAITKASELSNVDLRVCAHQASQDVATAIHSVVTIIAGTSCEQEKEVVRNSMHRTFEAALRLLQIANSHAFVGKYAASALSSLGRLRRRMQFDFSQPVRNDALWLPQLFIATKSASEPLRASAARLFREVLSEFGFSEVSAFSILTPEVTSGSTAPHLPAKAVAYHFFERLSDALGTAASLPIADGAFPEPTSLRVSHFLAAADAETAAAVAFFRRLLASPAWQPIVCDIIDEAIQSATDVQFLADKQFYAARVEPLIVSSTLRKALLPSDGGRALKVFQRALAAFAIIGGVSETLHAGGLALLPLSVAQAAKVEALKRLESTVTTSSTDSPAIRISEIGADAHSTAARFFTKTALAAEFSVETNPIRRNYVLVELGSDFSRASRTVDVLALTEDSEQNPLNQDYFERSTLEQYAALSVAVESLSPYSNVPLNTALLQPSTWENVAQAAVLWGCSESFSPPLEPRPRGNSAPSNATSASVHDKAHVAAALSSAIFSDAFGSLSVASLRALNAILMCPEAAVSFFESSEASHYCQALLRVATSEMTVPGGTLALPSLVDAADLLRSRLAGFVVKPDFQVFRNNSVSIKSDGAKPDGSPSGRFRKGPPGKDLKDGCYVMLISNPSGDGGRGPLMDGHIGILIGLSQTSCRVRPMPGREMSIRPGRSSSSWGSTDGGGGWGYSTSNFHRIYFESAASQQQLRSTMASSLSACDIQLKASSSNGQAFTISSNGALSKAELVRMAAPALVESGNLSLADVIEASATALTENELGAVPLNLLHDCLEDDCGADIDAFRGSDVFNATMRFIPDTKTDHDGRFSSMHENEREAQFNNADTALGTSSLIASSLYDGRVDEKLSEAAVLADVRSKLWSSFLLFLGAAEENDPKRPSSRADVWRAVHLPGVATPCVLEYLECWVCSVQVIGVARETLLLLILQWKLCAPLLNAGAATPSPQSLVPSSPLTGVQEAAARSLAAHTDSKRVPFSLGTFFGKYERSEWVEAHERMRESSAPVDANNAASVMANTFAMRRGGIVEPRAAPPIAHWRSLPIAFARFLRLIFERSSAPTWWPLKERVYNTSGTADASRPLAVPPPPPALVRASSSFRSIFSGALGRSNSLGGSSGGSGRGALWTVDEIKSAIALSDAISKDAARSEAAPSSALLAPFLNTALIGETPEALDLRNALVRSAALQLACLSDASSDEDLEFLAPKFFPTIPLLIGTPESTMTRSGRSLSRPSSQSVSVGETSQLKTDADIIKSRDVAFAGWVTDTIIRISVSPLMCSESEDDTREAASTPDYGASVFWRERMLSDLFSAWALTLRSPALFVKLGGLRRLTLILEQVLALERRTTIGTFAVDFSKYLSLIPVSRLKVLTARWLSREMEDAPRHSRYLQALVEFSALVHVAEQRVSDKTLENRQPQFFLRLHGTRVFYTDTEPYRGSSSTTSSVAVASRLVFGPHASSCDCKSHRLRETLSSTFDEVFDGRSSSSRSSRGDSWTLELWLRIDKDFSPSTRPIVLARDAHGCSILLDVGSAASASVASSSASSGDICFRPGFLWCSAGEPSAAKISPRQVAWPDARIAAGKWVHVAIVATASAGALLFLDGTSAGMLAWPDDGNSGLSKCYAPTLGLSTHEVGSALAGDLHEVRLWRIARTPAEIIRDMRVRIDTKVHCPLLYAHFSCIADEGGDGHAVTDSTDQYNRAVAVGASWVRVDQDDTLPTQVRAGPGVQLPPLPRDLAPAASNLLIDESLCPPPAEERGNSSSFRAVGGWKRTADKATTQLTSKVWKTDQTLPFHVRFRVFAKQADASPLAIGIAALRVRISSALKIAELNHERLSSFAAACAAEAIGNAQEPPSGGAAVDSSNVPPMTPETPQSPRPPALEVLQPPVLFTSVSGLEASVESESSQTAAAEAASRLLNVSASNDRVFLFGEIEFPDAHVTATVVGTREATSPTSSALSFFVIDIFAGPPDALSWFLWAKFDGTLADSELSGTWSAVAQENVRRSTVKQSLIANGSLRTSGIRIVSQGSSIEHSNSTQWDVCVLAPRLPSHVTQREVAAQPFPSPTFFPRGAPRGPPLQFSAPIAPIDPAATLLAAIDPPTLAELRSTGMSDFDIAVNYAEANGLPPPPPPGTASSSFGGLPAGFGALGSFAPPFPTGPAGWSPPPFPWAPPSGVEVPDRGGGGIRKPFRYKAPSTSGIVALPRGLGGDAAAFSDMAAALLGSSPVALSPAWAAAFGDTVSAPRRAIFGSEDDADDGLSDFGDSEQDDSAPDGSFGGATLKSKSFVGGIRRSRVTWDVLVESAGSPFCIAFGVAARLMKLNSGEYAGSDALGWVWQGNCNTYHNSSSRKFGETIGKGDVVSLELDLDAAGGNGTLEIFRNGKSLGLAFEAVGGPPSATRALLPVIGVYDENDAVRLLGVREGLHYRHYNRLRTRASGVSRSSTWFKHVGTWSSGQQHGEGVLLVTAGGAPPAAGPHPCASASNGRDAFEALLAAKNKPLNEVTRAIVTSAKNTYGGDRASPLDDRDHSATTDDTVEIAGYFSGLWSQGEMTGPFQFFALPPRSTAAIALSTLPVDLRTRLLANVPGSPSVNAAAAERASGAAAAVFGETWERVAATGPWFLFEKGVLLRALDSSEASAAEAARGLRTAAADALIRAAVPEALLDEIRPHAEIIRGSFYAKTNQAFAWNSSSASMTSPSFDSVSISSGSSSGTRSFVGSQGFVAGRHVWAIKIESGPTLEDIYSSGAQLPRWLHIGVVERDAFSRTALPTVPIAGDVTPPSCTKSLYEAAAAGHSPSSQSSLKWVLCNDRTISSSSERRNEVFYGGDIVPVQGTILYVYLDMDAGTLSFSRDNRANGQAHVHDGIAFKRLRSVNRNVTLGGLGRSRVLYPYISLSPMSRDKVFKISICDMKWLSEATASPGQSLASHVSSFNLLREWDLASASAAALTIRDLPAQLREATLNAYRTQSAWARGGGKYVLRAYGGVHVCIDRSHAAIRRAFDAAGVTMDGTPFSALRGGDAISHVLSTHPDRRSEHEKAATSGGMTIAGAALGYVWCFDSIENLDSGAPSSRRFGGAGALWYFTPRELETAFKTLNWVVFQRLPEISADAAAEAAADETETPAEDVIAWALNPVDGHSGVPRGDDTPPSPWTDRDDEALVAMVNDQCHVTGANPFSLALGHSSSVTLHAAPWAFPPEKGGLPLARVRARFALLTALNTALSSALPLVDFSMLRARGLITADPRALEFFSILGARLAARRRLLYFDTKRAHMASVLKSTEDVLRLDKDTFEPPDGFKSGSALKLDLETAQKNVKETSSRAKRRGVSSFGAFASFLEGGRLDGRSSYPATGRVFTRSYVTRDESLSQSLSTQPMAFKFTTVNKNGREDAGGAGPYRTLLASASRDDAIALGLVAPTPNSARANDEKMVTFAPYLPADFEITVGADPTLTPLVASVPRPIPTPEKSVLADFRFWGSLVGLSVRADLPISLDMPPFVWRPLVSLPIRTEDIATIDAVLAEKLCAVARVDETEGLTTLRGAAVDAARCLSKWAPKHAEDAAHVVGFNTRNVFLAYLRAAVARYGNTGAHAEAFFVGLDAVLPTEIFPMWSPEELEAIVMGRSECSENDLRVLLQPDHFQDNALKWLWATIEGWGAHENASSLRLAFFRFVTARTRPPKNVNELTAIKVRVVDSRRGHLPSAQTCFHELTIGSASSYDPPPAGFASAQAFFADRLEYAITNCSSIERE
jgi:hypothetical protein